MVKVKSNWNGDVLVLNKTTNHVCNNAVAYLPLCCAAGALNDDRRLKLFCCIKDCCGPLKVVLVECADAIVALLGTLEHGFCAYKHAKPPFDGKLIHINDTLFHHL